MGHTEHRWGIVERCGYMVMLQLVELVFKNVLQYSTEFYTILWCHMTMLQSQMLWKAHVGSHDGACD